MNRRTMSIVAALLAVLVLGVGSRKAPTAGTRKLGAAKPTPRSDPVNKEIGDWPMFRQDTDNSGYTPTSMSHPSQIAWTYSTHQPIVCSPAVVGGRVYIGSRDSTLYALDAQTGRVIWSYKTSGWVDSSPTVVGSRVYFASRDGYVYCLSIFGGRLLWRQHTGGRDCSSPAVVGDILYNGSGFPNFHLVALHALSGRSIGSYPTDQPVYSSPAVKDGIICMGSNDGKFYAFTLKPSVSETQYPPISMKWSFQTGGGIYFSSPAISDSLVYCVPGNYDKNIYCLRLSDGSVKWQYEVENKKVSEYDGLEVKYGAVRRIEGAPSRLEGCDWTFPFVYVSSPALANGVVYFVSGYPEQSIWALDALDGSLVWSQPIGTVIGLGYCSSPVIAGSTVWVGSGSMDGTLYAFHALTGSLLWSQSLGSPIISSPAIAYGRLYVATWGGDICCFHATHDVLASARGEFSGTLLAVPESHALLPPAPNPFALSTTITFAVPRGRGAGGQAGDVSHIADRTSHITLAIYDLSGRLVKTLVDEVMGPGYHEVSWDGEKGLGERAASGIYFLRLTCRSKQKGVIDTILTRKLTLLR